MSVWDDNNLYQYHLEFGVLTINEIRRSLGLETGALGQRAPARLLRARDAAAVLARRLCANRAPPDAIAIRVVGESGSGIDDRILLRIGDQANQIVTLEGDGERFRFADFAFVRIRSDTVIAHGDLKALTLKMGERRPNFVLNGSEVPAQYADGALTWGR